MAILDRDDFSYFDETEYYNMIGEDLSKRTEERGFGNQSVFLINYVSNQIRAYIYEHTAKNLYKIYDEKTPNDYQLKLGLTKEYAITLTDEQVKAIKLACIYQCDYILDNGSPERMSGTSVANNFISKQELKEFEVCSISRTLLANAGLLYAGIGGGLYAWIK